MKNKPDITLKKFINDLAGFMLSQGIHEAVIAYYGYEGSQKIDGVGLKGPELTDNGKSLLTIPLPDSLKASFVGTYEGTPNLRAALTAIVFGWLKAAHPGWAYDDGSSGEIVIDCQARAARIEHVSYRTTSRTKRATKLRYSPL